MVRAQKGVLVECDPSIKAIIMKINVDHKNTIVIEDLDDEHVLISQNKLESLKALLNETLKDTLTEVVDSGSD